jgi:hypothetical protein
MLKEVKMFTIQCDNCSCDVNENCEYSGWNDENYVEEIRQESGWEKVDDKHYCPDCFEYDDNDELIIKNKK